MKRVDIFKDGDLNFSPVSVNVSEKNSGTFDGFLDELNTRVPLPFGVRNVYTPKGRTRVQSLDAFENGKQYVATSQHKIKRLDYNATKRNNEKRKRFIVPRPPSNMYVVKFVLFVFICFQPWVSTLIRQRLGCLS